jgi:hypothetical protein
MAEKSKRIRDILGYLQESVPGATPVGGADMAEGDIPADMDVEAEGEVEMDEEELKKKKKRRSADAFAQAMDATPITGDY